MNGSAGAKGALGGAATGAAIGSVAGPWGTAIGGAAGGIIGGLGGLFSGDGEAKPAAYQDRDQIMALINAGYGVNGLTGLEPGQVQAQRLATGGGDDPFRNAQLRQLRQLQQISNGQQQGAGELAAQRQYANALAAQQAQARMARGTNAALAYRNAANQSAALGSTAAGMGQQAALQDQMNAQSMLGQVGNAGRQGDYNIANANAGYAYNASAANAQNRLSTQALNSQNYLGLLSQLSGMDAAQLAGDNAAKMQNAQAATALQGGLLSAGGTILGAAMQNRQAPAAPQQQPQAGNSDWGP